MTASGGQQWIASFLPCKYVLNVGVPQRCWYACASSTRKGTRRRLARERKRCFSSSSEDGSRKESRWIVGEFYMSYGGESCEITQIRFYTQTLSQTRLHTETFTHRGFYTQTLLHADSVYTQALLHADTCTHKHFHRHVYTQRLLHTEAFTHRHFYTQTLLHTGAFTRRCFYTQKLLHTDTFTHKRFCTQTLLYTDAFTHRGFYTQTLLHADAFTHTHFHTQRLLHTEAFEECLYMTFYGPELNCSVFDIKHMMASSSVANVCRHFTSEVLSHVSFTASWYRSFLGQVCGIFHNKMK